MICIEGHFEAVDNMQDVSRIIRKYYNEDLAYELDKLIEDQTLSDEEVRRLEYLEEEVEDLTDTIDAIRSLVW